MFKTASVLAAVLALSFAPATLSAGARQLTILHFNDLHGHIESEKGQEIPGGAARMATVIKRVQAENDRQGFATVVLFAGDSIPGTPMSREFDGEAEMRVLSELGVDAMVIGNHEFDEDPDGLRQIIKFADFPVISSNVYVKESGERLAPAFVELDDRGLNIGIVGVTMRSTPNAVLPSNVEGIEFKDGKAEAREAVGQIRKKDDVVIALTHEGVKDDVALVKSVKGIDAVIGGHDHVKPQDYCRSVKEVPICQTPANGKYLGRVDIDLSGETPSFKSSELIELSKAIPEDKEVAALVGRYSKEIAGKYKGVVGRAQSDLSKGEGMQSPLGAIVAEAMIEATGAQAAFVNADVLRASLKTGPITLGDVATALPFPNKLVILRIKGSELFNALAGGVSSERLYPQVAGMELDVSGGKLRSVKIDGKAVEPKAEYRVATTDYVVLGSGYKALKKIPDDRMEITEIVISDAFAEYIMKRKVLK